MAADEVSPRAYAPILSSGTVPCFCVLFPFLTSTILFLFGLSEPAKKGFSLLSVLKRYVVVTVMFY